MRAQGLAATLFISSWPASRHSRACMCIWVQGLRRREGGAADLTPYRTPQWVVCRSFCFGNGPVGPFLDESWGWLKLPPGGSLRGCVDVVAVVVIMPRCLGPGGRSKMRASNRWDSLRSDGRQSGLVLSHENVGSTKSWGPGLYTGT